MNDYNMRTSYGRTTNHSQYNHVPVAHSNGCCSSKTTKNIPSQPVVMHHHQQQQETPRQTAHERSHQRLDSPDPFYHRHGRIKKNFNRTRKPYQSPYSKNQIQAAESTRHPRQTNTNKNYQPVQTTATTKNNCCCTIL